MYRAVVAGLAGGHPHCPLCRDVEVVPTVVVLRAVMVVSVAEVNGIAGIENIEVAGVLTRGRLLSAPLQVLAETASCHRGS